MRVRDYSHRSEYRIRYREHQFGVPWFKKRATGKENNRSPAFALSEEIRYYDRVRVVHGADDYGAGVLLNEQS